jgi:hypothetical protein
MAGSRQNGHPSKAPEAAALLDHFANLIDAARLEERRSLLREIFEVLWISPHQIVAHKPRESIRPLLVAVSVGHMGCPMGLEPTTT